MLTLLTSYLDLYFLPLLVHLSLAKESITLLSNYGSLLEWQNHSMLTVVMSFHGALTHFCHFKMKLVSTIIIIPIMTVITDHFSVFGILFLAQTFLILDIVKHKNEVLISKKMFHMKTLSQMNAIKHIYKRNITRRSERCIVNVILYSFYSKQL